MLGTRSRAILATCTERSPIRSSSVTIRSAATTTRRSPATGAWRESRENAVSSTRTRASSITTSALMTRSAISAFAGQQRLGGAGDRLLDLGADRGEVVEDRLELVVEELHAWPQPRSGNVSSRGDDVNDE